MPSKKPDKKRKGKMSRERMVKLRELDFVFARDALVSHCPQDEIRLHFEAISSALAQERIINWEKVDNSIVFLDKFLRLQNADHVAIVKLVRSEKKAKIFHPKHDDAIRFLRQEVEERNKIIKTLEEIKARRAREKN